MSYVASFAEPTLVVNEECGIPQVSVCRSNRLVLGADNSMVCLLCDVFFYSVRRRPIVESSRRNHINVCVEVALSRAYRSDDAPVARAFELVEASPVIRQVQ